MRFNYTLDAPSPVLQYLGSGWTPIQGADASNYRNNTAIRTSTKGDSLQFSFNGTGIWVYGSERSTNGNFDVIVDTSSWSTNSTAAVGQDQFQTLVFGVGNLTNGPHEITITNRGFGNGTAGGSFDVDWIKWEGALPDNSKHQVIRNSNAAFKYLPGPTWWSYGQDNQSFDGQLYYTQSSSAEFQFNFVGSSIELYGYLDTNHGNFSCSIDGVSRGTYSGYYPKNVYQQLICFGDNLDGGSHTISVQNLPLSANDGWFSIDYARLSGTTVGAAKPAKASKTGAIVGGILGSLVGLVIIGGLVVFLMRRRRQQQQQRRSGHRVSQPVPHRDVWDIDPYPQPNTGGETDSDFHGHVTPYFDASDARTEMAAASEAGMASAAMYAQSSTGRSHAARTSIHTIAPSDSQSQAAFPHSPFPQSPFIAHSPQSSQQLYPPVAGPSTSAGGKERYRTQSDVSAASSRYRAPRPEQDAGPLLPVGESEESLSDDEAHAVAQETLPPMYSSIGGSHFTRNQQAAEAAARAAKAAGRPQLRVVGESSTTRDPPDEDS